MGHTTLQTPQNVPSLNDIAPLHAEWRGLDQAMERKWLFAGLLQGSLLFASNSTWFLMYVPLTDKRLLWSIDD